MEAPENLVRFMREKQFEIRYNELEVEVRKEELELKEKKVYLVFSPQTDTKKGIYAKIEKAKEMKVKLFNPYALNPAENEGKSKSHRSHILRTRGLASQNRGKVGLLEVARIPLKKRKMKLKRREREEEYDQPKMYVLSEYERLLVYRKKGTKEEDYASWPVMLEVKLGFSYGDTEVIKANLGDEIKEKDFRDELKKEEIEQKYDEEKDSTERKQTVYKAKLKLGIRN